jgi:hypothetical protein
MIGHFAVVVADESDLGLAGRTVLPSHSTVRWFYARANGQLYCRNTSVIKVTEHE